MTIAITIPLHSRWVPSYLEKIIDKRVRDTALSCLEKLVDWIASRLYCPYRRLLDAKLERVHLFSDAKAKLYDCTEQGIAQVKTRPHLRAGEIPFRDDIMFLGLKVVFPQPPGFELVFAREGFSDYVVVKDGENRQIQILEQEIPRPEAPHHAQVNRWRVNLQEVQQGIVDQPIPQEVEFYLAQMEG